MIIKDTRYIIKRIIIGVGICLVLGFINSCNVKAEELINIKNVYNAYTNQFENVDLNIYSNEYEKYFLTDINTFKSYCNQYSCSYINSIVNKLNNNDFSQYINQYDYYIISDNGTYNNNRIIFFNSEDIHFRWENPLSNNNFLRVYITGGVFYDPYNNSYTNVNNSNLLNQFKNAYWRNTNNTQIFSYNPDRQNIDKIYISSEDIKTIIRGYSIDSKISSLGVHKNLNEEENVITSYSFSPTFTNFNTTNFTYQYKIGNNNWLNITTNDVSFNVNQNTTVYFRILNNSNEQVVDSQSFTITNILKYDDNVNQTYNVKYNSENKSVNDNESKIKHTVDNVSVFFEYFPKQSNLKYQYQFVNEGESLSTWVDMPSQDYERTFTTTENGTLFNRILDSDNNILYSSTFSVNSIGTLIIDDNASWYGTLFDKIGYGKGISEIFFLPVKILEILRDSLIDGICLDYSFGELWGHELKMPCINIRSLVGNNIYNFIDIVGVGVVSFAIINFIVNIYNGIVFMNLQDKLNDEKGSRLL